MLTIKNVADIVGESTHTIRYYAKEGLFPFLTRDKNGVRLFKDEDIEGVRIVLCLRDTNMPISEIKKYMELCKQGASTIKQRLAIIQKQKERVYEQLNILQEKIHHLEQKEQFYINAIAAGDSDKCNPFTEHK